MPTPGKPILKPWMLWGALLLGMLLAMVSNALHGPMPDPISEEALYNQYRRQVQ